MGHLPLLKIRRAKKKRGGLSILESVEADSRVRNPSGREGHSKVQSRDECTVAAWGMYLMWKQAQSLR